MRNPLLALIKNFALAVSGHGLGRVKVLRGLYEFTFRLLRPKAVNVQGHKMWLDDKDTLELATREVYEPVETEIFLKQIRPGSVVLDIGANIGYYTLIAARQVGPRGRVFAFEPDPTNFQLLKKNVEQNGYHNAVLVNKAVSRKTGKLKLFRSATNRGDHRIYDSKDGRPSITIEALALDDFFKKIDKPVQFIKMDIQGSEALALEGMRGLIRKNRSLKLVAEFEPRCLKACGSDPGKFLKNLGQLGFTVKEISEKEGRVKAANPQALLEHYTVNPDDYTNLYCVKGG